jgi:dTDP-4-dehydrorhamnose 3,5-epimerase
MNIQGVTISHRISHTDERQTFTEVFKHGNIKQVNVCDMREGVFKFRHYHLRQTDWWWVQQGKLMLHLHDLRYDSATFGNSDEIVMTASTSAVVHIPPMVAHGCTVLEGPCTLIYATDRFYDPSDEYRIP